MITLCATNDIDTTYIYYNGYIRNGGEIDPFGFHEIEVTANFRIICAPDSIIGFNFRSEHQINPYELICQSDIKKHFQWDISAVFIDLNFLHIVELYYLKDGFADLPLVEYLHKIYD